MFESLRRHNPETLARARGDRPVDLLLTNANLFVPTTKEWILTDIAIANGIVVGWGRREAYREIDLDGAWVTPGFIDAHMHIESTKLWIPNFVEAVLPWGTVAVANDPHEMANVAGIDGVRAMIQAAMQMPFTFGFSASSCVPASGFESSGAIFDLDEMKEVLGSPLGIGIAEVMNYPGVIHGDEALIAKIAAAGSKRVDGHAPGMRGRDLDAYLCAGIESDHEMVGYEEAVEKRRKGMWVFLRQGSASQNIPALARTVIESGTSRVALCSDDREPDLIKEKGHMNHCISIAVESGISLDDALVLATLNPAEYHGFKHLGIVGPGYQADLNVFTSMDHLDLRPHMVFQRGELVAEDGEFLGTLERVDPPESVRHSVRLPSRLVPGSFSLDCKEGDLVRVIEVTGRSLWTAAGTATYSLTDRELNQLAVVERHAASGRMANGLVRGFGLKQGAIASTVAHDAHNLMIVGANGSQARSDMATAGNRLAEIGGGQVVCLDGEIIAEVRLPIAGLMSDQGVEALAPQTASAREAAMVRLGCSIEAPFMTLSFLGLSVIPELKLTDKGLVDVTRFELVDLVAGKASSSTSSSTSNSPGNSTAIPADSPANSYSGTQPDSSGIA
ncbi:MAG: adenine deaminase [Acidimicrobiales bacterium]